MPIISIENMAKTYRSKALKFTALRGVSLSIDEGEFVMLMGPSGCGKTTLLNIIGCMDTFDGGRYTFGGADIAAMDSAGLSRFRAYNIGYVFQAYNLVDELNCADNVELTMGYAGVKKAERRKRADELLARMGLADKRKNYPSQLSGGQQQRVAIARALSNNPKLILADEPTGNLDQDTGGDIMNLLAELNRGGTTVLMATHNPEMTGFASRVVHMRDGNISLA